MDKNTEESQKRMNPLEELYTYFCSILTELEHIEKLIQDFMNLAYVFSPLYTNPETKHTNILKRIYNKVFKK